MPDPGYGPNGEYLAPSGAVDWQANAPPRVETPLEDVWYIYPLGVVPLPYIDQDDDEVFHGFYLGGFP